MSPNTKAGGLFENLISGLDEMTSACAEQLGHVAYEMPYGLGLIAVACSDGSATARPWWWIDKDANE